jgi:hypothetical protein
LKVKPAKIKIGSGKTNYFVVVADASYDEATATMVANL